ncbi:MAG: hypothetical protein OEX22_10550, partial [Cyclobacteriaceae bacterium]|nr:hypothetical protein [Cyclobacteriaceae bacterium]
GISSTGLRAASFIVANRVNDFYHQLTEAARNHFPLVVQLQGNNVSEAYKKISNTGCFMLVANSVQEATDFTLIAHRIAELSLIPGVVFTNTAIYSSTENVSLPEKQTIINYLGNPDDHIESPTPSQKMIFGNERRRIPNWFTPDLPMASSISKNSKQMAIEVAANHRFFIDHLKGFINQAFLEFEKSCGRKYSSVVAHNLKDTDYAILVNGIPLKELTNIVDGLSNKGQKMGGLSLTVLSPFPKQEILAFAPSKGITILENVTQNMDELGAIYGAVLSSFQNSKKTPEIYSGQFDDALDQEAFEAVLSNMKEKGKQKFYVNITFSRKQSDYPKQQILLQQINREYPSITDSTCESTSQHLSGKQRNSLQNIPNVVRRYKDKGAHYAKKSRFYDNTGVFYQTNTKEELIADPFNSFSAIPPATSNFINYQNSRKAIAAYNPSSCTGCGDCFVSCPHAALPPIAISIESIVNSGIRMATAKGTGIVKITPIIKNLSKNATAIIQEAPEGMHEVNDFLPKAFEQLIVQMKLEGEKLNNLKIEFDALLNEIATFPVSINDTFFNDPEHVEKGEGQLFSIAVDANACTGCGVCAEICKEEALLMVEPTNEVLEMTHHKFNKWEALPDTDSHTLAKMLANTTYDSFSALLLSRNFYLSMTGGSTSEKGAPSKAVTHLITAATEYSVHKNSIEEVKKIDEHIQKLSENIHHQLSDALPSEYFDDLGKVLEESLTPKQSIDDIIHKLSEKNHAETVDAKELSRKVALLQELKNLKWVITDGPTGVGKSRYGLTISHSDTLAWASEYPYNSFTTPTLIHWDGSAPSKVIGLFYGQLRFVLDHIKILRRATLEAKNKYDPSVHDKQIAAITWGDLDENERLLVPPMLLIVDKNEIAKSGVNDLSRLLDSDFPIKVFMYDDLSTAPDYYSRTYLDHLLPYVSLKNAFVMTGSLANPSHLFSVLSEGLHFNGPGLFYIHTPDQYKHSTENWKWHQLPDIAMKARTFPCLKVNPNLKNKYFASSFNFDGNKQVNNNWIVEEIQYVEHGEEKTLTYEFTFADWLFTLNDWSNHFNPVSFDVERMVFVSEYLNIDSDNKKSKIPIVTKKTDTGLAYFSVSEEVILRTQKCLTTWNTLKEIGGVLIEFPDKLKKQVEEELKKIHDADLEATKSDYEDKLKAQEAKQVEKIRVKLRNRLVELSKQNSN